MANGTVPLNYPSFSDPRVILVRTDDAHCGSYWSELTAGCEQDHDGPTHLTVGRYAGNEALCRLASRFNMNIARLQAFRDNAEPVPSALRDRFTSTEAAAFRLLRRCSDVHLWSSTTTEHVECGQIRKSETHYHITEGEELGFHHIKNLEHAMLNFEHSCKAPS